MVVVGWVVEGGIYTPAEGKSGAEFDHMKSVDVGVGGDIPPRKGG